MVRTFLKVYMELGSYFLFLQEQIKDIIIIVVRMALSSGFLFMVVSCTWSCSMRLWALRMPTLLGNKTTKVPKLSLRDSRLSRTGFRLRPL